MGHPELLTLLAAALLALPTTAGAGEAVAITPKWTVSTASGLPLKFPSDAAFTSDGGVVVVDSGNDRLVLLNPQGAVRRVIGGPGREPGRFSSPLGVAIGPGGLIYVADTGNRRIQIFEKDGSYRFDFPLPAGKKPADPTDLAIDLSSGLIALTDNDNHVIRVVQPDGREVTRWGGEGDAPGQFKYPFSCVIDIGGSVLVTDTLNARIQFFTFNGEHQASLGEFGLAPGKIFRPSGVARDGSQRVWVTDPFAGVIQVYDPRGDSWSTVAPPSGQKWRPYRIAIDENRVLVVEDLPGRVTLGGIGP
jgi:DNA-binding beta-propeller fold protein YncE